MELHFYMDLILNFFCEYLDPETNIPIRGLKEIATHYILGWFPIDFISVFPFQIFFGDSTGVSKLVRLARLPRLIKLIDVQRFKNILKSFQGKDTNDQTI